jgi:hypothetical protein
MRSILLVPSLLVMGCVGQIDGTDPLDPDPDPDPGVAARTQYTQNVHPIMARCQGTACHSLDAPASSAIGKYYVPDAAQTYIEITNAPSIVGGYESIAPIITKIDAGHQGVSYSGADRTAITAWLAAETRERADDPTQPPPVDPLKLLQEWSACMTLENFTAAQMPQRFGGLISTDQRACRNCHNDGAFGFTTSLSAQLYFNLVATSKSQNLKYFSVANGKVVINMGALTNAGTVLANHPPFDPVNNLGMPALQQFYDLTETARLEAGDLGCGEPKLINP